MTLSEYLNEALKTWAQRSDQHRLRNATLGVAGEVGEVVEAIKKFLYHGKTQDETRNSLRGELGDLFYYIVVLFHERGWGVHALVDNREQSYTWAYVETIAKSHEDVGEDLFASALKLSALTGRASELTLYYMGMERNDSAETQSALWFLQRTLSVAILIGAQFGLDAEEIARYNIAKLRARHPGGWKDAKVL